MCGRYALGIRASAVRYQLQQNNMRVDDAPEDDEVRETYNFAPGSHGLVYRADVPDYGAGNRHQHQRHGRATEDAAGEEQEIQGQVEDPKETQYKLQSMKWGLVPFWTKRNPDYGSVMKTINARDDSLAANGGMWNTMKRGKRCVVVAQGFYEWLKKNGGKEKIPHYTKRKDGQLMCFAGLWDCVQYEGSEEKNYTYTIITTDSNKQLSFLHDRMPVILENGSEEIRIWLDPSRSEWSKDLQSLLKPYNGELECYPVSKEVGKVGNNSPSFIVPIGSSENKKNIANFFSNSKKTAKGEGEEEVIAADVAIMRGSAGEHAECEKRVTAEQSGIKNNASVPDPASTAALLNSQTVGPKRRHDSDSDEITQPAKLAKKSEAHTKSTASPEKSHGKKRSATSNQSKGYLPKSRDGSQQITRFFNK